MKKYPLIGVSIVAVVILIVASLSNVVGFQTVQTSNQKPINGEVNQKELLFKTILDIANNREIQRILLNSEMRREGFFNSGMRFSVFTPQVLTKNNLKHMYIIGLILSKTINKSKIHLMVEHYQVNNQEMQNEINAAIENDAILKGEMKQLSELKCDCENDNTTQWNFPIFCVLLAPFAILAWLIYFAGGSGSLGTIVYAIGGALHCFWY